MDAIERAMEALEIIEYKAKHLAMALMFDWPTMPDGARLEARNVAREDAESYIELARAAAAALRICRKWGYGPPESLAPGWYWVKDAEVGPMVVHVVRIVEPDGPDDDGLRVIDDSGGMEDVSSYAGGLWCGPILPPPDDDERTLLGKGE